MHPFLAEHPRASSPQAPPQLQICMDRPTLNLNSEEATEAFGPCRNPKQENQSLDPNMGMGSPGRQKNQLELALICEIGKKKFALPEQIPVNDK